MTDLFSEAARDVAAEQLAERCALAKVAVADVWTFLALAQSVSEFEHRLALARDHIAAKVDPDLLDITCTGLGHDFVAMQQLRQEETNGALRTEAAGPAEPPVVLQPGLQFFHAAQGRWITLQAADLPHQPNTRDNPFGQGSNYFENAAEEGPNTGQTGTYPQFPAGPDPVDPLNSMFPMQPSAWTVPPNAGWVERPMNLQPGAGQKKGSRPGGTTRGLGRALAQSAVRSVLASAGYVDEGVQTGPGPNPDFFGGGSEGIGGDPQSGYPEDLAVEDPDDRVNEIYGDVPPQQSSGSGQGGAQPYSNPGVARQGSVRHTAPGGGEHAPYRIEGGDGGYYVVNAKGERKNSEPKSKEEARQFQKALYKNVPGARESAEEDEHKKAASFFDPTDLAVRVVAQAGDSVDSSGEGMAPQPPQSMMPDGVGTIAQEPLPPSPGAGAGMGNVADPGGADAANKIPSATGGRRKNTDINLMEIARVAADNVRQRPNDLNPSGVADEYDAHTWEGGVNTRPRQSAEDRNINTPQTPRDPIPQASSTDIQRELSEDEERLRQAARLRFEQQLIDRVAARTTAGRMVILAGTGGAR
jgi:hypothetical protein